MTSAMIQIWLIQLYSLLWECPLFFCSGINEECDFITLGRYATVDSYGAVYDAHNVVSLTGSIIM